MSDTAPVYRATKFTDPATEVLWTLSLDGWGDSTGSTECDVYVTKIDLSGELEQADIEEVNRTIGELDLGKHFLSVPATDRDNRDKLVSPIERGYYLVMTDDQGFVWTVRYDSEREWDQHYGDIDAEYSAWLDANNPD